MPERDTFQASLQKRLFPESLPRKSWRLWPLIPSFTAMVFVFFLSSIYQNSTLALADAIANTIHFTSSEELVSQTIRIEKTTGLGSPLSHVVCIVDGKVDEGCDPETFTDISTWWLYKDNARADTTWIRDGVEQKMSALISAYDQIQCNWDSSQMESETCIDLDQSVPFEPLENDASLELANLMVKPYLDPDAYMGDLLITWESDALLENPMARFSNGPSGYAHYGFAVRSYLKENGKVQNEILHIYSEELRFNASNAYYPDENEKTYVQIMDDAGKSEVYLLNLDDYTLAPVSDAELEDSRENYRTLAHQFELSTERMRQDYELKFSDIRYLQENLSRLKELEKNKDGNFIIFRYGLPADLGFYGGANDALISEASFTVDQDTQRITEYSFYDAAGTEVEHGELSQSTPDAEPESLFTKEAWLKSF